MRECISGLQFLPKNKKTVKPKTELEKDRFFIGRLYKYAPHKGEQLKILSQLYLKSEMEIAQFLFDNGIVDSVILSKIKKV